MDYYDLYKIYRANPTLENRNKLIESIMPHLSKWFHKRFSAFYTHFEDVEQDLALYWLSAIEKPYILRSLDNCNTPELFFARFCKLSLRHISYFLNRYMSALRSKSDFKSDKGKVISIDDIEENSLPHKIEDIEKKIRLEFWLRGKCKKLKLTEEEIELLMERSLDDTLPKGRRGDLIELADRRGIPYADLKKLFNKIQAQAKRKLKRG